MRVPPCVVGLGRLGVLLLAPAVGGGGAALAGGGCRPVGWCWAAAAAVALLALAADGRRGLCLSLLAVAVIGGGHAWRLAEARRIDARVLGANGRADLQPRGHGESGGRKRRAADGWHWWMSGGW